MGSVVDHWVSVHGPSDRATALVPAPYVPFGMQEPPPYLIGHNAEVTAVSISEIAAGWLFTFSDGVVTQLRVDHVFTLALNDAVIHIEVLPFELSTADGSVWVLNRETGDVAPTLGLLHHDLHEVAVSRSGRLEARFVEGDTIVVEAEPGWPYESWQIVLESDQWWVGTPGGGVSTPAENRIIPGRG